MICPHCEETIGMVVHRPTTVNQQPCYFCTCPKCAAILAVVPDLNQMKAEILDELRRKR